MKLLSEIDEEIFFAKIRQKRVRETAGIRQPQDHGPQDQPHLDFRRGCSHAVGDWTLELLSAAARLDQRSLTWAASPTYSCFAFCGAMAKDTFWIPCRRTKSRTPMIMP